MAGANGVDLNLLAVLSALLEQRHVTRAGERLSLSQPTMSGALARLRLHFGDELLVRSGRGYQLTPLASNLLPAVREALAQVERTVRVPVGFDPSVSVRRFRIAMSSQSLLALSGRLRRVHELAPLVRLDIWPVTTTLMQAGQGTRGYDVLIAPEGFAVDGAHEVVARERVVYVTGRANPRLREGALTPEDLAALPHAVSRMPQESLVNEALAGIGVTPKVVASVGGWIQLPFLVAGTDLVAAVPEGLARQVRDAVSIAVVEPPFDTIELVEAAWWHPALATDPALSWLRRVILGSLD